MNNWDELKRLADSVPDNYSNETAQYVIFSDAADPQAILALIAENEALRKDAERYRWLRSHDEISDWGWLSALLPDDIDKKIDEWSSRQEDSDNV